MCVRVSPWYNDSVRATKCLIRQLERIWRTTGLECDTQIYITEKHHQEDIDAAVETIEQCVAEIRSWMKTNSLKWNNSKTEVIVYGSAEHAPQTHPHTHAPTDTRTHINTHPHRHTHARAPNDTRTHTHAHTRAKTRTQTHTHPHSPTPTHVPTYTQAH